MTDLKRKTLKLCKPNPLFEKWLKEWKDEAASRNSDIQYAFAKTLQSLRKYPLPLKSGKECMILEHFETRICLLLDRKLSDYKTKHTNSVDAGGSQGEDDCNNSKTENSSEEPKRRSSSRDAIHKIQKEEHDKPEENKKRRKTAIKRKNSSPSKNNKMYIPTFQSSSYAVLVALYRHLKDTGPPGEMRKEELQNAAQPLCDTSMWKPLPGSYYSGWSCVGQLVSKGLLVRRGNPHRFSLTEDGVQLAEKLPVIDLGAPEDLPQHNVRTKGTKQIDEKKTEHVISSSNVTEKLSNPGGHFPVKNVANENSSQPQSSQASSTCSFEQIILQQGQFDIILLIDTQEIHRGDDLVKAVESQGVKLQVRKLQVGDFAWIARNTEGQELLLPYIVERKRLDDLASSIKDGRFHEQKFRMKQSGVPNCMYLVEGHGNRQFSLPISTLLQATVNTQFVDRFTVKYTENFHETVVFLASFTKVVTRKFANLTLVGCQKRSLPQFNIQDDCISLMTFSEFNKLSTKTRKYCVKEMFIKQLVQLRGLSVEKAIAIVDRYPSPRSLATAFQNEGSDQFIAEILVGNLKRKIGPAISKAIYALYNKSVLT